MFRYIPPIQYEEEINLLKGIHFVGKKHQLKASDWKKIQPFFALNPSQELHPFKLGVDQKLLMERLIGLEKYLRNTPFYVDVALKRVMHKKLEEFRFEKKIRPDKRKFQNILSKQKIKLFPYQKEGVLSALGKGRFLLADDMGLG